LPLQSITHAASRTTKLDGDITPAELPSGRVRFADELGRETALVSRRESPPARRADDDASDERPPTPATAGARTRSKAASGSTPNPSTTKATRAPPKSERGKSAAAPPSQGGDDEIALALAELGLAAPPPPTPPSEPPPELDLSGTRLVANGALAAATADPAMPAAEGDAFAAAPILERGDRGAAELAPALLASAETEAARDPATETKVSRAADAKVTGDVARLLEVVTASHASAAAARAPSAAPSAARPAAATPSEPPASPAAGAAPRVPLADLTHALPALVLNELRDVGPRLRFGRRGANWEVEMRLDPPELGSLKIRFELHGETIRGAIQCEPRVERLLGPVLKELEEELGRQGANASFDLSRQSNRSNQSGDDEGRASAPRSSRSLAAAAAVPLSRAPSARNDPSRLVDVTA
jgi:flagellar hook-length control protein FliK